VRRKDVSLNGVKRENAKTEEVKKQILEFDGDNRAATVSDR